VQGQLCNILETQSTVLGMEGLFMKKAGTLLKEGQAEGGKKQREPLDLKDTVRIRFL
jgi:hypothetical protein